jgi:hypothetical protein
VAALTAPGGGRSLLRKAYVAVTEATSKRTRGKPSRVAAAVAVAREHVVTAAALVMVDIGAFHGGQIAGYVVTGLSLLALDFAVRG